MRIVRIAAVTAGLVAAGALVGALVGVLAFTVWMLPLADLPRPYRELAAALPFVGMYGAAMGAVLGPVAAWLLMRRVPLWKAIGGTALGTLAGSLLGLVGDGEMGFAGAFLGFGAAAFLMWLENAWKTRNDALDGRELPRE
ncbi:MAG: hypothetical protein ABW277_17705 [Longimicrobiaceae bacterium]